MFARGIDRLVEKASRRIAQRSSRRGFVAKLGVALAGGALLPVLPVDRRGLLLSAKAPFVRSQVNDEKTIVFYTMMPIHTVERDFVLKNGLIPLLEKFAEQDVEDYVDLKRKSVVKKGK